MFLFILNLLVQELLIRKYQIVNKPEIIQFNGDFQENTRLFILPGKYAQNEFSFLIFNLTVVAVIIDDDDHNSSRLKSIIMHSSPQYLS